MDFLEAKEEYASALRQGQKEYKEMLAAGKSPHPAVLDDLLDDCDDCACECECIESAEEPCECECSCTESAEA